MSSQSYESPNDSNESQRQTRGPLSRRRFFAVAGGIVAVGAAGGAAAGIMLWETGSEETTNPAAPEAVELSAEATAEEKARIIAQALSAGKKVTGVDVAIDYHLMYPEDGDPNHPEGIGNPLLLGKDTYGYATYNDATGEASVVVAPPGGTLKEATYGPAMEQAGQPRPNPRFARTDISPAYYESTVYSKGRFYVTAIDKQPGLIPGTADVTRAGSLMQVGK